MAFVLMQIWIYIHFLGSIIFGSHWMNNVFSQLLAFSLCWTVSKILSYCMKLKHTKESAWTIFIHLCHWLKKKLISSLHSLIYLFSFLMQWNSYVHTFHGIIYICYWLKIFLGPCIVSKIEFLFSWA